MKKTLTACQKQWLSDTEWITLTLGQEAVEGYREYTYTLRFIKVTPKGFNILNVERNKCIIPRAICARGWAGKAIPNKQKEFKVRINKRLASLFIATQTKKPEKPNEK